MKESAFDEWLTTEPDWRTPEDEDEEVAVPPGFLVFVPTPEELAEARRSRIEELEAWAECSSITDEEKDELDGLVEEERACL